MIVRHIALTSDNDELVRMVAQLSDRLAPIRNLDNSVLQTPFEDLGKLERAIASGDPLWAIRDMLRRYHSLRMSASVEYVRLLAEA